MRVDIGGDAALRRRGRDRASTPTPEAMVPKPTLVLLHGGPGSDHSSFRPYFDRFADTHQVVYVDHRGQGRSDGREDPAGWDLDTWADDVVRLCDALEIERPVVLGLSFGGFVAIRYAARHPGPPVQGGAVEHAGPAGRRRSSSAASSSAAARRRRPATAASTSTATPAPRRGPTTPGSTCRVYGNVPSELRTSPGVGQPPGAAALPRALLRHGPARRRAPHRGADPRAGGARRPDDPARVLDRDLRPAAPTGSGGSRSSTAPGTASTATSPSAPSRSSGSSWPAERAEAGCQTPAMDRRTLILGPVDPDSARGWRSDRSTRP